MNRPPTPGERRVLKAIHESCSKRGVCPTVREIATAIGLTHGTVQFRINRLVDKKLVSRMAKLPRSLTVTSVGKQQLAEDWRPR